MVDARFDGHHVPDLQNRVAGAVNERVFMDQQADTVTGDVITLTERATGEFNKFPIGWREKITLTAKSSSKMKFAINSRDATVRYDYSVQKAILKNKKVSYGKLVLTYGDLDDLTFKDTINLFFQGPDYGTYKSIVAGNLLGGTTFNSATTWGSFKLQ